MRVALVHDWLDTWGGGEAVLAEITRIFPGADIYTLVDFLPADERKRLGASRVTTSRLQHLPWAKRWFRYAAALRPQLIEGFDLSGYELVISNSHSIAKGVRTSPGQVHVCYCLTPARFAWSMESIYAGRATEGAAWRGPLVRDALARFREWDRNANARIDRFITSSRHIAAAIVRCYGRQADVIHPPVDVERFAAAAALAEAERSEDTYVTVSRLVPYKRVDVLIEAFRSLPDRKLVVIGDGPDYARLAADLPPNVELAGWIDDEALALRIARSRAFLFAAEEDFGIAPIEAQAAGTPVIAFGRGGVLETVRGLDDPVPTGAFFDAQTPAAAGAAIREFEAQATRVSPDACRENAARFSAARFRAELASMVDDVRAGSARNQPVMDPA